MIIRLRALPPRSVRSAGADAGWLIVLSASRAGMRDLPSGALSSLLQAHTTQILRHPSRRRRPSARRETETRRRHDRAHGHTISYRVRGQRHRGDSFCAPIGCSPDDPGGSWKTRSWRSTARRAHVHDGPSSRRPLRISGAAGGTVSPAVLLTDVNGLQCDRPPPVNMPRPGRRSQSLRSARERHTTVERYSWRAPFVPSPLTQASPRRQVTRWCHESATDNARF